MAVWMTRRGGRSESVYIYIPSNLKQLPRHVDAAGERGEAMKLDKVYRCLPLYTNTIPQAILPTL